MANKKLCENYTIDFINMRKKSLIQKSLPSDQF